jgi:hypothetical protein
VLTEYGNRANELDAYIFCMSMDKASGGSAKQDILSQWRAYGQDGRGVALTLDTSHLVRIVRNVPTMRINPVIYSDSTKNVFVDLILDAGFASATDPNAVDATVAALVFATPLMKASGFAEECEWRLIFMPPVLNPPAQLGFHPRRDFLAPFFNLSYIWKDLRPRLAAIPQLLATLPQPLPLTSIPPLVPITKVMIGPSGHQDLNIRAIGKLLAQANRAQVTIERSEIPYRSLG